MWYNIGWVVINLEKVKFDKIAYNNRFIAQSYDRINLIVPKGNKDRIKAHAEKNGESINRYINRLIDSDLKNYTSPCSNSKGRTDRE